MVIFSTKSNIEKQVSPESMDEEKMYLIENSDPWKQHLAMHKKAGLGNAKLFVSGEAVLGEKRDPLRERLGLKKEEQNNSDVKEGEPKIENITYGPKENDSSNIYTTSTHNHSSNAYMGSNNPDRPGFWATCNCGAEFNANVAEDGHLEIKTYTVESSVGTANETAYDNKPSVSEYRSGNEQKTTYQ